MEMDTDSVPAELITAIKDMSEGGWKAWNSAIPGMITGYCQDMGAGWEN